MGGFLGNTPNVAQGLLLVFALGSLLGSVLGESYIAIEIETGLAEGKASTQRVVLFLQPNNLEDLESIQLFDVFLLEPNKNKVTVSPHISRII